jgi:hypothetical protein
MEKPDRLVPLNNDADYRQCSLCSQLDDSERGFQKLGQEEQNTYLPAAAQQLQLVREVKSESGGPREIWQCPECTTCYLYRTEYEFLYGYGGSEDTQELTRLTVAETVEWLKRINAGKDWMRYISGPDPGGGLALFINERTKESVSVDTSEPGYINVHYVQLEDGLDMGGRLLIERKSVPLIMALLYACLNVRAFPDVECKCGDDAFRVYGSGLDQQPIINILNRRPDGVEHAGLSGLMMTTRATEALFKQLRELG